jgi:hypothetical protein
MKWTIGVELTPDGNEPIADSAPAQIALTFDENLQLLRRMCATGGAPGSNATTRLRDGHGGNGGGNAGQSPQPSISSSDIPRTQAIQIPRKERRIIPASVAHRHCLLPTRNDHLAGTTS